MPELSKEQISGYDSIKKLLDSYHDGIRCQNKLTEGEELVGTKFNAMSDNDIDNIKQLTENLIDIIEMNGKDERLTEIAIKNYTKASMFAVKSLIGDK